MYYVQYTNLDDFVCFSANLFEMHYDATFLHHGILLIVVHQVSKGVEPLAATYIIFTVLLKTHTISENANAGAQKSA